MKRFSQFAVCLFLGLACCGCAATRDVRDGRVRSFDGVEIAYDARGAGNPAVLFLHGWCCHRGHWDAAMDALAPTHRVVAIDLPGHGSSGRDRDAWDLPALARDVETVTRKLRLRRVILVGHSMGGPVSLLAAARMPHRVVGVIGVDTLHNADAEMNDEAWDGFIAAFEADFPGTMDRFVRTMFVSEQGRAAAERIAREAAASDPDIAVALLRSFKVYDPREALRQCPAPVHCINAAQPNPTNITGQRQYRPDFDAVLMDGVGHFPMLDDPQEFNRLLAVQVDALSATSAR